MKANHIHSGDASTFNSNKSHFILFVSKTVLYLSIGFFWRIIDILRCERCSCWFEEMKIKNVCEQKFCSSLKKIASLTWIDGHVSSTSWKYAIWCKAKKSIKNDNSLYWRYNAFISLCFCLVSIHIHDHCGHIHCWQTQHKKTLYKSYTHLESFQHHFGGNTSTSSMLHLCEHTNLYGCDSNSNLFCPFAW